ncbi:class I adenylate-forming enzyme family protein [Siccirubricoccus sp. G192]|uniref:class I adenylate-forming enzyme family protein n=1 Tax=Siccirubricoccus sp. G192 TaxID=2849651 RepID=UPI0020C36CE5|nr:AMP-binding protein [Siccirubricoccus sp. G192]
MAALPARIDQVIEPWAERTPDAPALAEEGRAWTYGELARNVGFLRDWLRQHGVRPGDRVMVVAENGIAQAVLILAISAADAWVVNVNARLSAREIDLIRDHSGARRVLYTAAVSPDARAHAERHGAALLDLPDVGPLALGPLAPDVVPEPAATDPAKQVAVLLYTSGTTGAPKGVMLSHHNILFIATTARVMRKMGPGDRLYGILPLAHIVGFSTVLTATLMSGGSVHFAPRFQPEAALATLERQRITRFLGVPAMFQRIREHCATKGVTRLDLPDLALISASGAPLDLDLKEGIEQLFGLPLNNGYGITECSPTIAMTSSDKPRRDESVGEPIPGIELRLLGPDHQPVAPGEVGEIHVRGPGLMQGYYRAPDLTAAVIDAEGWFNTGDLARMQDGALWIVGRSKELIIRSGFNVYPPEIEAVLNAHPDVTLSAVVGRKVPGNEEVVAFVQLRPGAATSAAGLAAFAAARLAPYKRPAGIVLLDALPTNPTGKILKQQLAQQAASGPAPDEARS